MRILTIALFESTYKIKFAVFSSILLRLGVWHVFVDFNHNQSNLTINNHMKQVKGYLVPIGGAEDKGDQREDKGKLDFQINGILKNVVDLMKGREPGIEIITTATSSPDESYKNYKRAFSELGCSNVGHLNIRDREAASDKKVIQRLERCSGVLFSGGDQARLCAVLGGTLLLELLKERYAAEHFVIAGTSAGAAAMSSTMMNGGDEEKAHLKGEIDLQSGFGFIDDVIIDTQFDARGRFMRLAQAIASQPGVLGIGLGEDTGIIVEKENMLKAIGSKGVIIIDGSEIQQNNIADIKVGSPISVGKFGVYIMSHSDGYDIRNREFKPVKFEEYEK
jgi:cyanophycinase